MGTEEWNGLINDRDKWCGILMMAITIESSFAKKKKKIPEM